MKSSASHSSSSSSSFSSSPSSSSSFTSFSNPESSLSPSLHEPQTRAVVEENMSSTSKLSDDTTGVSSSSTSLSSSSASTSASSTSISSPSPLPLPFYALTVRRVSDGVIVPAVLEVMASEVYRMRLRWDGEEEQKCGQEEEEEEKKDDQEEEEGEQEEEAEEQEEEEEEKGVEGESESARASRVDRHYGDKSLPLSPMTPSLQQQLDQLIDMHSLVTKGRKRIYVLAVDQTLGISVQVNEAEQTFIRLNQCQFCPSCTSLSSSSDFRLDGAGQFTYRLKLFPQNILMQFTPLDANTSSIICDYLPNLFYESHLNPFNPSFDSTELESTPLLPSPTIFFPHRHCSKHYCIRDLRIKYFRYRSGYTHYYSTLVGMTAQQLLSSPWPTLTPQRTVLEELRALLFHYLTQVEGIKMQLANAHTGLLVDVEEHQLSFTSYSLLPPVPIDPHTTDYQFPLLQLQSFSIDNLMVHLKDHCHFHAHHRQLVLHDRLMLSKQFGGVHIEAIDFTIDPQVKLKINGRAR